MIHRRAYEILVGRIPDGLVPDHLCRVRHCWNPQHIELVTHGENIRRGDHHERRKTHCPAGHAYDDANTGWRDRGRGLKSRCCRACRREYSRAYDEQRRQVS